MRYLARPVSEWDYSDLQSLVGVEENSNLEFKQSEALENTDKNKNEMAKDVSALANAAGGIIVYGIVEVKGGLADHVDKGTTQTPEWIDQVLATNIEPKIANLTIKRIPLPAGKFAYVVDVPMAVTFAPHQAKAQKNYYRRHNTTVLAMLDHEVRDLMRRASSPDLFLNYEFIPWDGNQFEACIRIGNHSESPALYTSLDLVFEDFVIPPVPVTVHSIGTPAVLLAVECLRASPRSPGE